ncbi:hypothetical protein KTH73_04295 [Acinetobacter courvalinii]|uniref:hypothetical protein n=1 Tax=Acinetobacter courvalinii TaxID=280147 RepID=UPI0021CD5047|nr:hypothetical protein [Acinetobacter courvalinii]MCU4389947.1 hypothetical protein [Acinetobacter courvalinii]
MKKIIIGVISLMFTLTVSAESRIEKQETKNFPTMKQCINWLDSKFPNKQWHNGKGMPWDLAEDSPHIVYGATYLINKKNNKLTHPVALSCEYKETGTQGNFYEGTYSVSKAR